MRLPIALCSFLCNVTDSMADLRNNKFSAYKTLKLPPHGMSIFQLMQNATIKFIIHPTLIVSRIKIPFHTFFRLLASNILERRERVMQCAILLLMLLNRSRGSSHKHHRFFKSLMKSTFMKCLSCLSVANVRQTRRVSERERVKSVTFIVYTF